MKDKKECFIANLEGIVYIIPTELRDEFEGTSYYDRESVFSDYILTDDVIFDSILIDSYDLECLINGDLG